ncbi:hypothetical protein F4805DRAFT_451501 [Annulohypoxylon moriforme]|nr:hypothetical protein F4805DRAFT_451501 [Annulohypoxylon moriforme]
MLCSETFEYVRSPDFRDSNSKHVERIRQKIEDIIFERSQSTLISLCKQQPVSGRYILVAKLDPLPSTTRFDTGFDVPLTLVEPRPSILNHSAWEELNSKLGPMTYPSTNKRVRILSKLPIQNPLQDNPYNNRRQGDFIEKVGNITAALVQVTGERKPSGHKCYRCMGAQGRWDGCVVSQLGYLKRSCANCYYNGHGGNCSFYEKAFRAEFQWKHRNRSKHDTQLPTNPQLPNRIPLPDRPRSSNHFEPNNYPQLANGPEPDWTFNLVTFLRMGTISKINVIKQGSREIIPVKVSTEDLRRILMEIVPPELHDKARELLTTALIAAEKSALTPSLSYNNDA